jgi:hypothetical protein
VPALKLSARLPVCELETPEEQDIEQVRAWIRIEVYRGFKGLSYKNVIKELAQLSFHSSISRSLSKTTSEGAAHE